MGGTQILLLSVCSLLVLISAADLWSETTEWTTCSNDCFYSGWCDRGRCKCDINFDGTSCEDGVCLNLCGGGSQGRCSGGYCICKEGWGGIDCETWVGCPNYCSGQGTCGLPAEGETEGKCDCDPGYFEVDCRSYYPTVTPDVRMNRELSWIIISFPFPMTINGDENCERFMTSETIKKLGNESYCWGGSRQEVWVRVGNNASFILWDDSEDFVEDYMETTEEVGITQGSRGGLKPPGRSVNWVEGSYKIRTSSTFPTYKPSASLQAQSNPVCGFLVLDGSSSDSMSGQNFTYGWHFGGENNPEISKIAAVVETSTSPVLAIDASILVKGTYDVFLTVTDYLGFSDTTSLRVRPRFTEWTLSIGGGSFQRPYSHLSYRIDGVIDTAERCGEDLVLDLDYEWTVLHHSSDFESESTVLLESTSPILFIAPYTLLPFHNYTVSLSVEDQETRTTISMSTSLSVLPPPVHLEFKQRRLVIPDDQDSTFEVYDSTLRKGSADVEYKYYWNCVRKRTNEKCFSNPHILGFNQSSIEIPRNTLPQNETFYLSVSLQSRWEKSTDRMTLYTRDSSKISPPHFVHIEGGQDSKRLVVSKKNIFRAVSSSSSTLPGSLYRWDIKDGGYGVFSSFLDILFPPSATITTLSRDTLIISPNVLLPNFLYNLTFSLESELVASVELQTLDVPRNGSCSVTPSYGISYSTFFSLDCHSFVSSTASPSTFRYTFHFSRGHYENKTRFLIHETSGIRYFHSIIPQGDPNNEYKANISVTVADLFGSATSVDLPIQIFPSEFELKKYLNMTKRAAENRVGPDFESEEEEEEEDELFVTRREEPSGIDEDQKKFEDLKGLIEREIGTKDFSKSLSQISIAADLLNAYPNSELDENSRFDLFNDFEGVIDRIETESPEALNNIPFLTLIFDTFRQLTENPFVFQYKNSRNFVDLLNRLIPYYKEALRLYEIETTDSQRELEIVEEHAELHESMIDLIGDLIAASNNHKISKGRYLVDELLLIVGNITDKVMDSLVLSSDPITLWGNRLAMSLQYSPRDFLARATSLTGEDKPVPKSIVPAIQFSSDVFSQVPTQIYLIFTWFSETPYPWSEDRVHSSVTDFQIMGKNRDLLFLKNVSQIRVFAPEVVQMPPPSDQYEDRCQWWDEEGRWSGRGCSIAGEGICHCKEGTMFSFGYYLPAGAEEQDRLDDDWWTNPGMWIAIAIAIIVTIVGIICMYLLPWKLLRDLRRMESENTY